MRVGSGAGGVAVFGRDDGQGMRTLAPLVKRPTMKYYTDGTMNPAHLRVGIYSDPVTTFNRSLHVDGITVATTRAAAEGNAFKVQ